MKKERNIGEEILAGIREVKEWQQGKKKLKTTRMELPRAADVAKIRQNLDLTQDEFADFMGVNVKTLQNWEQKRREPQGPARSLLRIAEKAPEAILKALPRKIHRGESHHSGAQKRKSSSR
jgi:putative transcriptional regulator